jgi:hypothetical protein
MMRLGSERIRYLIGNIHAIAPLVVKDYTIATCGHTTVNTKRCSFVAYASVVSIKAEAWRSNAVFSTVGSSLPRAEALRRIP